MKFLVMVRSKESSAPPPPALMGAIGKLGEEAVRAGTLVQTGGLFPSASGVLVRVSGGKLTVTDGPFSETKEVIGGFAMYELPSRQAAIDESVKFMRVHQEHWPGWEGESEIRQVSDNTDFAASAPKA